MLTSTAQEFIMHIFNSSSDLLSLRVEEFIMQLIPQAFQHARLQPTRRHGPCQANINLHGMLRHVTVELESGCLSGMYMFTYENTM